MRLRDLCVLLDFLDLDRETNPCAALAAATYYNNLLQLLQLLQVLQYYNHSEAAGEAGGIWRRHPWGRRISGRSQDPTAQKQAAPTGQFGFSVAVP